MNKFQDSGTREFLVNMTQGGSLQQLNIFEPFHIFSPLTSSEVSEWLNDQLNEQQETRLGRKKKDLGHCCHTQGDHLLPSRLFQGPTKIRTICLGYPLVGLMLSTVMQCFFRGKNYLQCQTQNGQKNGCKGNSEKMTFQVINL